MMTYGSVHGEKNAMTAPCPDDPEGPNSRAQSSSGLVQSETCKYMHEMQKHNNNTKEISTLDRVPTPFKLNNQGRVQIQSKISPGESDRWM